MDEELAKLLERKEKADKLPEKQLEKWKPEYEKLVTEIDTYEKYLENMYSAEDESASNNAKSGKISVIILSAIIVFVAILGYIVFKLDNCQIVCVDTK